MIRDPQSGVSGVTTVAWLMFCRSLAMVAQHGGYWSACLVWPGQKGRLRWRASR